MNRLLASLCLSISFAVVCTPITLSAQVSKTTATEESTGVAFAYPMPDAKEVPAETTIGLRGIGEFDAAALSAARIVVMGSISGRHTVTYKLSSNKQTLLIRPDQKFSFGETVSVNVETNLVGGMPAQKSFRFTVMLKTPGPVSLADRVRYESDGVFSILGGPAQVGPAGTTAVEGNTHDTIPVMPPMYTTVDNGPTRGKIYFTNFPFVANGYGNYLLEMDQDGEIVKSKLLPGSHSFDYKIQENGVRTYFDFTAGKWYACDSSFNVIDSFESIHGYLTDGHELRVFKDGSYMLLGMSQTSQDMSALIHNGFHDAIIDGSVIQVFDKDKNLTFEWRGIDHYNILDAVHENLLATTIDFEHANSLTTDDDGNIIMSNRHLSEITKISQQTGEMIWRFGGAHNQFNFVNDTIGPSYQHAARLLSNGHLTFFDNGNYHSVQESRAVEYVLDEAAMTAKLVWQYHHTPDVYGSAMGYVQRLESGNTLICWGADSVTMTEVRPDNTTAFEYHMGAGHFAYRAYKYEEPNGSPAAVASNDQSALAMRQNGMSAGISVTIEHAGSYTLSLYDLSGKLISSKECGQLSLGDHAIAISSDIPLSSGVYYCALTGENQSGKCKMVISR